MSEWPALAVSLGLLVANGFFVASEYTLTAVDRARIERLAGLGDRRAHLVRRSLNDLPLMFAGTQLGVTMASLVLGYVAEPAVGRLLEGPLVDLGMPAEAAPAVALVIALGIVVFFHMVLSEMAPKYTVIAEPERSALWIAPLLRAYVVVFRPILVVLNALANAGLRVFGVRPRTETLSAYSLDELASMIEESAREGALGALEERLLTGAVGFTSLDAGAVMVPRTEVVAVPATATAREVEAEVVRSGHSRLPVYAGDIDHVLGFLHAKDLLRITGSGYERPVPPELIRPLLVVPESRALLDLLFDMRRQRRQFALVIEEHGGTAGILTIEDILEELVGEIRDEYDAGELGIEVLGEGRFLVPGTLRIDEAGDRLGVMLPEGPYETVAGFVMDRLGRVPRPLDTVTYEGWSLRVQAMQHNRVVQLLIQRGPAGSGERT